MLKRKGQIIMPKVIKFKNSKTYTGKDGKTHQSYSKALELDNGKQILIRAVNPRDEIVLDAISEYRGK